MKKKVLLTLIILMVITLVIIITINARNKPTSSDSQVKQQNAAKPVSLTQSREMTFEDKVSVSGTIEASNYALVSARVSGVLDDIFVDEGDHVKKNETKLFQTDSRNLKRSLEIARQDLKVAENTLKEKKANLEKDIADMELQELDLERHRDLYQKDVVSIHTLQQQETMYKQSEANVKHSRALVNLAAAQMEQSRSRFEIAKKNLEDSLVKAPISGTVSQRMMEPGEMASAGTPVLKIENPEVLEASVYLPEEYYHRVKTEETSARVKANGIDLGEKKLTYKSPTVTDDLRTFEVKCRLENPPPGIVPGRIVNMDVILERRKGIGIPREAVEIRDGEEVIFLAKKDKAFRKPVKTGLETKGWIEVLDQGIQNGAEIITMGQNFVENGTEISIVREDL